jgi:hypothetical protein
MAQISQSRPDYGLDFQVKVLKSFQVVPSSIGSRESGANVADLKTVMKAPGWKQRVLIKILKRKSANWKFRRKGWN